MRTTTTLLLVLALGVALSGVVAVIPGADVLAPVGFAEARFCIIGSSGDCVIPIYCFTDPCP
jgi:hypothetical protein